jgi:hypothetical protein
VKTREELLDDLGRCYLEAALDDLLAELERKHPDRAPTLPCQGQRHGATYPADQDHQDAAS